MNTLLLQICYCLYELSLCYVLKAWQKYIYSVPESLQHFRAGEN